MILDVLAYNNVIVWLRYFSQLSKKLNTEVLHVKKIALICI